MDVFAAVVKTATSEFTWIGTFHLSSARLSTLRSRISSKIMQTTLKVADAISHHHHQLLRCPFPIFSLFDAGAPIGCAGVTAFLLQTADR